MLNYEHTGKIIKNSITSSKITYEDLAEYIGLNSPRVIYDWINGIKIPSTINLLKLSKLFNITINDLLET